MNVLHKAIDFFYSSSSVFIRFDFSLLSFPFDGSVFHFFSIHSSFVVVIVFVLWYTQFTCYLLYITVYCGWFVDAPLVTMNIDVVDVCFFLWYLNASIFQCIQSLKEKKETHWGWWRKEKNSSQSRKKHERHIENGNRTFQCTVEIVHQRQNNYDEANRTRRNAHKHTKQANKTTTSHRLQTAVLFHFEMMLVFFQEHYFNRHMCGLYDGLSNKMDKFWRDRDPQKKKQQKQN